CCIEIAPNGLADQRNGTGAVNVRLVKHGIRSLCWGTLYHVRVQALDNCAGRLGQVCLPNSASPVSGRKFRNTLAK
ncbi:MAG: hypothetical protein OER56_03475, partial [Hyphomicrobiales bacterium]|nr:hypothetical protein [Hyphomicrobiales bacterium]